MECGEYAVSVHVTWKSSLTKATHDLWSCMCVSGDEHSKGRCGVLHDMCDTVYVEHTLSIHSYIIHCRLHLVQLISVYAGLA